MAINIQNTNYAGEVLDQLLTLAATGNEIVDRGLIHIEPGIRNGFSIPRLKTNTMLQKRKAMPTENDSKGGFDYSEKRLVPHDFMAFTTFNPRSFESIWREFQPKGDLVFSELPTDVQNKLLSALASQVKFELGGHFINGEYAENGDDKLFNGIVTRMESDTDKIVATTAATTVIGKLCALYNAIPDAIVKHPSLRILMSTADARKYQDELIAQPYKGVDYSSLNDNIFKKIQIEDLSQWPEGLFVATLVSPDQDSNLWAAVNLVDDWNVVQIDKLSPAGEIYFFKLLMMADTNIAFGEEVVWLDTRVVSTPTPTPDDPDEPGDPA